MSVHDDVPIVDVGAGFPGSLPRRTAVQADGAIMTRRTTVALIRPTLTVAALGVVLVSLGSTPALAQPDESRPNAALVGAWGVQVTLRNCTTNAPLGPAFNSLVTFHRDGTISEAAASVAFAPGQRTPGHGVWTRESRHTYQQSMIALLLFATPPNLPGTPGFDPGKPISPGFSAGRLTVDHTVTMTDADHITSSGTNTFYDMNGSAYRTGCSSAVGDRFR